MQDEASAPPTPSWLRALWLMAGGVALLTGLVGIVLPLLPTTPFVLLAAFCFARGSARWERWLIEHRRFGPMIQAWRSHRAIPLAAKRLATLMMTVGCVWSWWWLSSPWRWVPALCCTAVALWMWRLPTAAAAQQRLPDRD
ncbi:MAG: YbaN family protein [Methylibium sp.]|uniref:YbaN family protein n=1 Tax=unclassified Methylibium TaxID=2633235 RepID=UPI0006F45C56|nr:YbaN family protein [Methylibium sp. Root1272]KQW68023.1 hypothetical protein ASC67_11690 [Methylibium sp. Root1272]MDP1790999.1 YbaN family protein [Methylibium sp.]